MLLKPAGPFRIADFLSALKFLFLAFCGRLRGLSALEDGDAEAGQDGAEDAPDGIPIRDRPLAVVMTTVETSRMTPPPTASESKGADVTPKRQKLEAKVQKTETRIDKKKFTVYKVVMSSATECWFVYRRYNEFYNLYNAIKKEVKKFQFKLPGKKLFGNNMDPDFIEMRRQGLDAFLQELLGDNRLLTLPDVRNFLQLDNRKLTEEKIGPNEKIDLGPTERVCARPSDFEFLHVIGKGSFGKVVLARHKLDGSHYAVKVLSKKLVMNKNEARHIMSERNVLLKNLDHPFLVDLKFCFQTPEKLYFVLDYINGGELFFHLQQERTFPESRCRFYAAEIASALGYLHSRAVIYRDLKPENILLDSTGHVVLTDFGLSKEGLWAYDTTDTFCGTPEYLAPEVICKDSYDKSVDWWCLGAVLYEMLFGLPPFYSPNTEELYRNILTKPLSFRHAISEQARAILLQLLEKDSMLRLGSGYGDFDDVKRHKFFKSIDWDDLLGRRIQPPFKPSVGSVTDTTNIDPSFTRERIGSSVSSWPPLGSPNVGGSAPVDADDAFAGFSYAPSLSDINV